MSFLSKNTYRTRPSTANVCLALVFVFFLGTTALWISLDHSPGYWDDAWYLTNSLNLYDTLVEQGFIAYCKAFLKLLEFKAPLIAVLPTPLYRLFGRSSTVAYGVNLAFMALLFGAVYRIARRYSSPRAGLMAVYLTATMPLLYGLSRQYLVEFGLTALVTTTVSCLVKSRWRTDLGITCLLGGVCGLGLMMKVTFPLYVFLPFSFASIQSLKPPAGGTHPARCMPSPLMWSLAFSLPLALIALPWYARNWSKTLDHALKSSFSPMADLYGMGSPFSAGVVWGYLTHWVNDGISGTYFLLLVAFVGIALWHRVQARQRWLPLEGRALALVWFLPFIMFLFGRNKDIRFTAPLLPAVAVTLAWMVDSVLSSLKTWGRLAFGLLLLLPLAAYLQTSFGLLGNTRLALESIVLMAPRLSHAGPPDRQPWPHQEILEVLRSFSEFAAKRTVMLASDTPHFNANNFELAAADGQYPFEISTSAYENDLPALLNATNSKMFILYKESGEQGPQFTNQLLKPLLEDVRTSGKFVDLSRYLEKTKFPELPDGGRVIVYKNEFPNSPIVETRLYRDGNDSGELELPVVKVNFSSVMRLTGLAFGIENRWLKVIYRWSCIEKLDEDLLCFTHVLDNQRRVIGFLDHVILADPDLTRQKGWSASESLRYRLPVGVNEVHLRLGLFRKSSGERVPIQEVSADALTLSLTDQGTAVVASGMTRLLPKLPRSQLE